MGAEMTCEDCGETGIKHREQHVCADLLRYQQYATLKALEQMANLIVELGIDWMKRNP